MRDIFEQVVKRLGNDIPGEELRRWISPLRFNRFDGSLMVLTVPNIFFKNWIIDKYLSNIDKYVTELAGREIQIEFEIISGQDSQPKGDADQPEAVGQIPPDTYPVDFDSGLTSKYTFENFVVGNSNQLAHAAALAVASHSATYNPLFVYGESGLGKTHLLNAIGNHLMLQHPGMKVVYRSSEEFTNELIEAIRTERMSLFRQKYRNIDALIIDDIQFIGGRERTQEEFFYTFNALYESEKQIILSSDKFPKDIQDLEDRLRSRFEGGLFADISAPDQETKVAILYRKAEEEGIQLPSEVGFYLASQSETNIRVLEGYLARLGAYSSLTHQPIDLATAQKLLGYFIEDERRQITFDLILRLTSEYFRIKIDDLKSAKKQQLIALPRQAAMYLARQLTGLSTIEIGQLLGGRDHSTVIHAVKKIEEKIAKDHSLAKSLTELEKQIRNTAAKVEQLEHADERISFSLPQGWQAN